MKKRRVYKIGDIVELDRRYTGRVRYAGSRAIIIKRMNQREDIFYDVLVPANHTIYKSKVRIIVSHNEIRGVV